MPSLTCTNITLFTVAAVLLQIIGLALFVLGFFPVKPALSGLSGPESYRSPVGNSTEEHNVTNLSPDQLRLSFQELSEIPPSFDRLVLMVIDGLPAEFLLGRDGQPPSKLLMDAMPYTQLLLANGMAIGYHAKAAPPTVTMPRLKAMLSGAIGGFVDVALNFNTQALSDDNLIGKFFSIGWKMVMLGDETWLKLFPGLFSRHDGVSSFYVKDTVEVDHNVSRHLHDELIRTDWNLLVLHYLGLDHVGHIGGRDSILMAPKLKEMDDVIKMIHLSMIQPQDNDHGRTLLMIVSDHGMTDSGNHGGSSYEETDSLALFVGLRDYVSDHAAANHKTVYQVDIVPTLALLFGVPIPKNNVGVLITDIFNSLTENERLRALELNSWQLLRLLYAQLPGLSCGNFSSNIFEADQGSGINDCNHAVEENFCCLYLNAAALHRFWKSKEGLRSAGGDDYSSCISAYHDFLRNASEWLSHRATDKPFGLLASGVAAMLLSCLVFLRLLFGFCREVYSWGNCRISRVNNNMQKWHLDETFILVINIILILSMLSSSMVEEEQYIWHFVTSTFYLVLIRKTLQSLKIKNTQGLHNVITGQRRGHIQMCSIIVVLIAGRILRGWHQGGVNWTHLPDISKWLDQAGSGYVKVIQLVSGLLLISLSLYALYFLCARGSFTLVVGLVFLIPGLFVLQHMMTYQTSAFTTGHGSTLMTQLIYAVLGIFSVGIVVTIPWFMPVQNSGTCLSHDFGLSISDSTNIQGKCLQVGFRDTTYLIGLAYIFSWCLLQLMLQQPINSVPVLLLLVQVLAIMCYYSNERHFKQWVEVAALYYLGMAGHFGLGNTNTLATIDVAGAYIGLSSHSTFLSGILMFSITYASPMLVLLSLVMYISIEDTISLVNLEDADFGNFLRMTVFPCLVPLSLNSILLVAYTIVLLLMRNHLFIWSVFSPKYLYVCATTVCVYVGVCVVASTSIYTCLVFALRKTGIGFHPK